MGAEFGTNSTGQSEIARIAGHILAHGGHGQGRDSVAGSEIYHAGHVDDRLFFVFPANEHLHRHGAHVQAHGFLDIYGYFFIGQLR